MLKLKSRIFINQYGASLRTPPLEGTPLHQRNGSVERPRVTLNPFVTCLQVQVTSNFVSHIVFLMVNHCRLLRFREFHSTNETIAWRDPGGS